MVFRSPTSFRENSGKVIMNWEEKKRYIFSWQRKMTDSKKLFYGWLLPGKLAFLLYQRELTKYRVMSYSLGYMESELEGLWEVYYKFP